MRKKIICVLFFLIPIAILFFLQINTPTFDFEIERKRVLGKDDLITVDCLDFPSFP